MMKMMRDTVSTTMPSVPKKSTTETPDLVDACKKNMVVGGD
jgi:hypothetical protein